MKVKTAALDRFRLARMFKKHRRANKKIADQFYIEIGGEVGMYRLMKHAAELRQEQGMAYANDHFIFEKCRELGI